MSTRNRLRQSPPARHTNCVEHDVPGWVMEKVGDLGVTHDIHAKREMLDAYCQENDLESRWNHSQKDRRV